jgi:hypothetical protein
MVKARWIAISAVFAMAASQGFAAQEAVSRQQPSFAGTWVPADPRRSEVLFNNGISSMAGVSGQGRLVIEQRPDRLTLTKQLSDATLEMMLNFTGHFETTTIYRIVMPQGGSGGLGAGGDTRSSWQGDRLVFQIKGAAHPTTVAFSLDGDRLKVETHVVVSPGKENNTAEWFTKARSPSAPKN